MASLTCGDGDGRTQKLLDLHDRTVGTQALMYAVYVHVVFHVDVIHHVLRSELGRLPNNDDVCHSLSALFSADCFDAIEGGVGLKER